MNGVVTVINVTVSTEKEIHMRTQEIRFTHRKKEHKGQVGMPESIEEAVNLLGEEYVFHRFMDGYLEEQRRVIRSQSRRKFLRLTLSELTSEQQAGLRALGFKI
jgi:hypothetical protein